VKTYRVNEIFYSVQGEGVRAGTPNVFVRLSGCNLQCAMESGPKSPGGFDCDTEFVSGRDMTADEIFEEAVRVGGKCINVIFTGGEPLLQLDAELCRKFLMWERCVETNGTIQITDQELEWVTVSPKVAEHAIRQHTASEVKYVRGYGQAIPKTRVGADHCLISPAFDGGVLLPRTVDWCVNLVKENPEWRLSLQTHKFIAAR